jgi:type IV fimbrial biogenesis protein FimT
MKGFTIIELVVVVAVIAILTAIAAPQFIDVLERNKLRQAAESLKSDTQFTRTESIKQSTNLTISKTTGNDGGWCYGISTAACDCTTVGSCSIKALQGTQFGNIDLTSASNTSFDFRRGTAFASNACLKSDNYTVKVYTNNGGRTLICSDTLGAGYPLCSSVGVAACP